MSRGFWQLVEARATATPDALMAVDAQDRELRFGEFLARAERVARALHKLGVGAETRVSWQLPTSIDALVLAAALARLGAVQNPILSIHRERELRFIAHQLEPSLLIVSESLHDDAGLAMTHAIASEIPDCQILVHADGLPESALDSLPPAPAATSDDAIRWILYTSGTTSNPKGVRHSDASLGAGARGMNDALGFDARDRLALVFPFAHIGGVGTLFCQLLAGFAVIVSERFDAERTPALLARHGLTVASGGTAVVQRLLEYQRAHPPESTGAGREHRRLFPDLRIAIASTAPKSPELHQRVQRELGGAGVVSCYGLTEAPFTTFSTLSDSEEQLTFTEGRAALGIELRILAEDGSSCAAGVEGEIRVRGPNVFHGYVDPDADAEAFDENRFFRTGDLGRVDEQGFLTVTGRIKEIIIRRGENISAKEIEDVLSSHSLVDDVAVVGVPDPALGERCCAVIVPRDPTATPDLDQLVAHCRDAGLAIQKIPEQLEIVAALPRNATGKVRKRELSERYA